VATEASRIEELNPPLTAIKDWGGHQVTVNTRAFLDKVATNEQLYGHTPPIGEFLKATGKVTGEEVEAAFAAQRKLPQGAPRRFLGKILEDSGKITKYDADAAERTQNYLKEYLRKIFQDFQSSAGA